MNAPRKMIVNGNGTQQLKEDTKFGAGDMNRLISGYVLLTAAETHQRQ